MGKSIRWTLLLGHALLLGGVMAAFGCNFEGDMPTERLLGFVGQVFELAAAHDLSIRTLSLADTMAWATPSLTRSISPAQR